MENNTPPSSKGNGALDRSTEPSDHRNQIEDNTHDYDREKLRSVSRNCLV